MKPKFFTLIIVLAVAWGFLGADKAFAQTPTPAPPPLRPLTNVVQEPDGSFSAWCGGDLINYRTEWRYDGGVEQAWLRVQWFHSDPRVKISRSFGYAVYDRDGNLRISAITPLMGPGQPTTPATFTEDPAGFWRVYVYWTGTSFKASDHPGVNPLVVMFFFRNRDAVCPLRMTFWFGGKG